MAQSNPSKSIVLTAVSVLAVVIIIMNVYKTVPVGHVGVATLFGKAQLEGYPEGLHIPVNPLYKWTMFDARKKTHLETANVPSQDQLQTRLDVSVQYRIDGAMAAKILGATGTGLEAPVR